MTGEAVNVRVIAAVTARVSVNVNVTARVAVADPARPTDTPVTAAAGTTHPAVTVTDTVTETAIVTAPVTLQEEQAVSLVVSAAPTSATNVSVSANASDRPVLVPLPSESTVAVGRCATALLPSTRPNSRVCFRVTRVKKKD